MLQFSPGPYGIHHHNPVILVDVNGFEIGRASSTGSRAERLANAKIFAASWEYDQAAYELAMLNVDAGLYGSNEQVRRVVNRIAVMHKQLRAK